MYLSTLRVYVGYHTWQFAAQAFSDALPWMAAQIHTPQMSSPQR